MKLSRVLYASLAILAALAVLVYLSVRDPMFDQKAFDTVAWKSGNTRARGEMVYDLEASGILVGKTRQDIVGILGPASRTSEFSLEYTVDVGNRMFFETWMYTLNLQLDDDVVVASYIAD